MLGNYLFPEPYGFSERVHPFRHSVADAMNGETWRPDSLEVKQKRIRRFLLELFPEPLVVEQRSGGFEWSGQVTWPKE